MSRHRIFGWEYGVHATISHSSEWRQPPSTFQQVSMHPVSAIAGHYINQCVDKNQGETLQDGGVSWWRAAAVKDMGSPVGSGRVFHRDGVGQSLPPRWYQCQTPRSAHPLVLINCFIIIVTLSCLIKSLIVNNGSIVGSISAVIIIASSPNRHEFWCSNGKRINIDDKWQRFTNINNVNL